MGVFCSFSEESLGQFLQKLANIEQIPINFTNCQFNCIIFVKEQQNISKIIIISSCTEELRTAKQWINELKIPFVFSDQKNGKPMGATIKTLQFRF